MSLGEVINRGCNGPERVEAEADNRAFGGSGLGHCEELSYLL